MKEIEIKLTDSQAENLAGVSDYQIEKLGQAAASLDLSNVMDSMLEIVATVKEQSVNRYNYQIIVSDRHYVTVTAVDQEAADEIINDNWSGDADGGWEYASFCSDTSTDGIEFEVESCDSDE